MADTNIKIKFYQEFKDDIKNPLKTLNLFYYYLSTSASSNDTGSSYHGKTDDQISSTYEPRVESYPYYLHILSTDIIDDHILVSKLVDPNINLANAKYIHVMYRVNEDSKYYSAYTVEIPSFNSEINKNDYNYLYLDLTELGSILADIRLNNTYPIYETSHVVDGDNEYIGSGLASPPINYSIQSPKSNIDKLKGLDDPHVDGPNLTFSTENFTRQYTEEFYHMGDFTIRLLGKSLLDTKITDYVNGCTPPEDMQDVNFLSAINPTTPNTRTLEYVSSDKMSKVYIPRVNTNKSYLHKVSVSGNHCYNILSFTKHGSSKTGFVEIKLGSEDSHFSLIIDTNSEKNSYLIGSCNSGSTTFYLKSVSSGQSTGYETEYYLYVHSYANINIFIYSITDYSSSEFDVTYSSAIVTDDRDNWIKLYNTKISSIEDSDSLLEGSKKVTSTTDTSTTERYGDEAIDFNDGSSHYLSFLDFDIRTNTKTVKRCIQKFQMDQIWNNCRNVLNNDNQPSAKEFNRNECILIRTINRDITEKFKYQSYVLNILCNTDGYHQVKIDDNYTIHMPPNSKFLYRGADSSALSWGGFIEEGISSCNIVDPLMNSIDEVNHYMFGLDKINYGIFKSNPNKVYFIRSNINKVHYIINNTDIPAKAIIYTHQCRYLKYGNATYGALLTKTEGYNNASYKSCNWILDDGITVSPAREGEGNIEVGVEFDLHPHSMTVYSNDYKSMTLYHRLLYRIPIYYNN